MINWQTVALIVTAVSSLGSLGSLALLFKFRADNKKTLAETEKLEQESKDLEFDRLVRVLDITTDALERCQENLRNQGGQEKKPRRKGF